MDWVLLLGRILFVFLFVKSGLQFHLLARQMAAGYARSQGAPAPEITVPLTGVLNIAAGVLIVLGIWVDLAALVLCALALLYAVFIHAFWKVEDPMERVNQENHLWKNISIIGGGLVLFYLFKQFGDAIDLTIGPEALF
jgi:putative oxidoreductase